MMPIQSVPTERVSGSYQTNAMAGSQDYTVSNEWASRLDDQRYLTLDALYNATHSRSENRQSTHLTRQSVRFSGKSEFCNDDELVVKVNGEGFYPTHWGFTQLCRAARAPASYLQTLNPNTAADALNESWSAQANQTDIQLYLGQLALHACNSATYGRLHDHRVVDAVRAIAASGRGEKTWKVPGHYDWQTGLYNPHVPPSKDTTTLYASDRDVFMFLVDDTRPIEIGKTKDGEPDLVFRGFYVWNSEVGSRSVGVATFLLRGVCQNRILWGAENQQILRIRHSKNVLERFERELAPALLEYTEASERDIQQGIETARSRVVAHDEDSRETYLVRQGFSKAQSKKVLKAVRDEEGDDAKSVWDMVQGVTALARQIPHQDERLLLEQRASKMLATVVA